MEEEQRKSPIYYDQNDNWYGVRQSSCGTYKACVHTPRGGWLYGWHAVKGLRWRDTPEEAEADLRRYAEEKGLRPGGEKVLWYEYAAEK